MPRAVLSLELTKSLEDRAYQNGITAHDLMENAGFGTAQFIQHLAEHYHLPKKVYILAGRGNNGGDAYVAAYHLKQSGFDVIALQLTPFHEGSTLLIEQKRRFESICSQIFEVKSQEGISFNSEGMIIDGLFGTGFHGKPEGLAYEIIRKANESKLPIVSIDIPSGVSGNTGEIEGIAIKAHWTICLEGPKIGCFIGNGWNHCGQIHTIPLGLDVYLKENEVLFHELQIEDVTPLLPIENRNRNKYSSGHVVALAGSSGMGGAAMLSSWAALRTGAGIVHLLHPESMKQELLGQPWEIIRKPYQEDNISSIVPPLEKAHSALIGPGLSQSKYAHKTLDTIWPHLKMPAVLDADALNWLALKIHTDLSMRCLSITPLKSAILTPHRGEMDRLLHKTSKDPISLQYLLSCQSVCNSYHTQILLKGGPSFIFSPHQPISIMPRGVPGMATAGSGDVLSGILAALLAKNVTPAHAVKLGSFLHGLSGELAAETHSPESLMASDIIEEIPKALNLVHSTR